VFQSHSGTGSVVVSLTSSAYQLSQQTIVDFPRRSLAVFQSHSGTGSVVVSLTSSAYQLSQQTIIGFPRRSLAVFQSHSGTGSVVVSLTSSAYQLSQQTPWVHHPTTKTILACRGDFVNSQMAGNRKKRGDAL
jgi:hypothetical protein